jgi:hypothetical protein
MRGKNDEIQEASKVKESLNEKLGAFRYVAPKNIFQMSKPFSTACGQRVTYIKDQTNRNVWLQMCMDGVKLSSCKMLLTLKRNY